MKNIIIICTCIFSINVIGINVYAAENKGFMIRLWEKVSSGKSKEDAKPAVSEKVTQLPVSKVTDESSQSDMLLLSTETLLKEITLKIRKYPDLIKSIPELSMRKSIDGHIDYYYKLTSDIPMKLNKFNRSELSFILERISKEIPLLSSNVSEIQKPELVKKIPEVAAQNKADANTPESQVKAADAVSGAMPELEIPYTKEDMLDVIGKRLYTFSQIAYMIPDFSMVQLEDGSKQYYYYTVENGNLAIEDLDKKTLHKLFVRINNEATILNTQRIMQQIQQQEQLTRTIQQQQQQVQRSIQDQRPPVSFTPPVVHTPPPQQPQPPKQPPQPPRS